MNKTTQLTDEQLRQRAERRQKIKEADDKRELQRRRLNKSTGVPQSGMVDTEETDYEEE